MILLLGKYSIVSSKSPLVIYFCCSKNESITVKRKPLKMSINVTSMVNHMHPNVNMYVLAVVGVVNSRFGSFKQIRKDLWLISSPANRLPRLPSISICTWMCLWYGGYIRLLFCCKRAIKAAARFPVEGTSLWPSR